MEDGELRARALGVLIANHRDGYTVPAPGLYPFQWCWDSGPIALGWGAAGRWDEAWSELRRLCSAQWASGMVPHIVFWADSDRYFPGPEVWGTDHEPPTTGLTQPPLPVSAAVRLYHVDPDRDRAAAAIAELWPRLVAWLTWFGRARVGPHGAVVAVHPWETGMDNSPSWDEPLGAVATSAQIPLARRDVQAVSATQRPSELEYRRYLGIVEVLRAAGWDTERQAGDSPFAVEDPCLTAVTARAAADLVGLGAAAGFDVAEVERVAKAALAGLEELWDDGLGWYRPYDLHAGRAVGGATSVGLVALWAGIARDRAKRMLQRIDAWAGELPVAIPTADPAGAGYDPIRYWRGPVWVLVNWLVADGLARLDFGDRAEALRAGTRALMQGGFSEYYDPRNSNGIGGHGFAWSAALTLAWLTA